MLKLQFEGWFQCRLATGDDDHEETRGKDGWTFAVPGEPNLDRVIRFNRPVAPRSHAPIVGVTIRSVLINEQAVNPHPLLGAPVDLLDHPVFEGHNGAIAGDAQEPIVPFHVQIQQDDILIQRIDRLNIRNNAELTLRKAKNFSQNSQTVKDATTIQDFAAYRAERHQKLQADWANATDAQQRAALEKRMEQLTIIGNIQEASLGFYVEYDFNLRHTWQLFDPNNQIGGQLNTEVPWNIVFWMGGWDADALSAYVKGHLEIPLVN